MAFNKNLCAFKIGMIVSILMICPFKAAAESMPSEKQIQKFQKTCLAAVKSTRKGNEKIQLCECIVRNHAQHLTSKEFDQMEQKYKNPDQKIDPKKLDDDQVILNDFDIDVAEQCQKKSNFSFQSPLRKSKTKTTR